MKIKIGNDWDNVLKEEFCEKYFLDLLERVEEERKSFNIFPKSEEVFAAFKLCSYSETKVVIIGQDPYHEKGQAKGGVT